jgi:hypothetical protein
MKLTRDEAAFLALCLYKAARDIHANFLSPESASAFYKMSKELQAMRLHLLKQPIDIL